MTPVLDPETMPHDHIRTTLEYRGREVTCTIPRSVMDEFLTGEAKAGRDWSAVRAVLHRLDTDELWPCHICGAILGYEDTGRGTSYPVCPASETHPV